MTMTVTNGIPRQRPLDVAVVRQNDLESRELALFDLLDQAGAINARAFGLRPTTPYGVDGLQMEIRFLPSLATYLRKAPFGDAIERRLSTRHGTRLTAMWGLRRALGHDVDVINARETFQPATLAACRYAKSHPRTRVVVSVFENIPFRYEDSKASADIKARVRSSADLFVANSPGAEYALRTEGVDPDRIVVVPPGVDTGRFSPGPPSRDVRRRWGAEPDDVVVLYAGRLLREKGLVELLVALMPLLAAPAGPPGPVLVLHGSGPENSRLRRVATELRITQRVRFSPWSPMEEMPDIYRSADLVVLPSLPTPYWSEQFGYNLAEALGCGRPVLSTRSGEIPFTLGDAGVLVAPYEGAELLRAVAELTADQNRRDEHSRMARKRALTTFSLESAGSALVDSFWNAVSRPPRMQESLR